MSKFSLLVRIQTPIKAALKELLDSLEAQTEPDWELVLAVDHSQAADWLLVGELIAGRAQVRAVLRPDADGLARTTNALLPTLGTWTGFLDQHDRLLPTALASLEAAVSINTRVVYSDECHRNRWERLSYHHIKGAVDPTRLRSQAYLGALCLFRTAHLSAAGGFDPLASDVPGHDFCLRTLEAWGTSAFVGVPEALVQHHRTYLEPDPTDPRKPIHLVRYDLYAVHRHLQRAGLAATVKQEHGTVRVDFKHPTRPSVTALVVVGDDVIEGFARIHAFNRTERYRPLTVKVLHQGESTAAEGDYRELSQALGYSYLRRPGALATTLNQELQYLDSDWTLLLQGQPINWTWLNAMVDEAQLRGVGAVSARCTTPRELVAPGTIGYRYSGWDWNTRGRFNRLQVPHQSCALGSAALLFNTRETLTLGGFNSDYPTLFAMDLTMRMDAAGLALINVPAAHVQVPPVQPPGNPEVVSFTNHWSGWFDRFNLHQSL